MKERITRNNRGFTLIEVIGVIIILGILSIIVIPIVDKNIKEGQEEAYKSQIQTMKMSLQSWASDNSSQIPDKGQTVTFTLIQLKHLNYLEYNIQNPKTKTPFPNDMLLTITNDNGKMIYDVKEDTGTVNTGNIKDQDLPFITLNGSILEYVELGSIYTDSGAVAKTAKGTTVLGVTVEISGSGTVVNTNNPNSSYTIMYTANDNGKITTIAKTVVVKATKGPNLIIPSNISIEISQAATFDLMAGVSATDGTGNTVPITISGTLHSQAGMYVITYTATDSIGNKTIKKRIITVKKEI